MTTLSIASGRSSGFPGLSRQFGIFSIGAFGIISSVLGGLFLLFKKVRANHMGPFAPNGHILPDHDYPPYLFALCLSLSSLSNWP